MEIDKEISDDQSIDFCTLGMLIIGKSSYLSIQIYHVIVAVLLAVYLFVIH